MFHQHLLLVLEALACSVFFFLLLLFYCVVSLVLPFYFPFLKFYFKILIRASTIFTVVVLTLKRVNFTVNNIFNIDNAI